MALSWQDLLQTGLEIGTNIYTGQVQRRAERQQARMAKSQSKDFPQLGMGLAATGPQRTRIGIFDASGAGVGYESMGLGEGGMANGDTSSVAVMGRGRFPTQLIVYTTPSGRMQVGGYRSIGTPLLWSGDFAAVKRVARVARRLGRFVRHRHPR